MVGARLALAGLLGSPVALADPPTAVVNDCAKARAANQVCVIVFEPERFPPPPPPIVAPQQITAPPMIRVPKDFIRQILKSADDVVDL